MKKLFLKFLSWLGYVPKERYNDILETAEDLQVLVNWHDMSVDDIHTGNVKYSIEELNNIFVVESTTKDNTDHCVGYPIKVFHFTEETRDYARLCAEELCEMLNEKH